MSEISLIFETNKALLDDLSNGEFAERFARNAEMMEHLFWEIVDAAGVQYDIPFRRRYPARQLGERRFEQVFRVTSGTVATQQNVQPLRAAAGGV